MNKNTLSFLIAFSMVVSFVVTQVIVELDIHAWWASIIVFWGTMPLLLFFLGGLTFFLSFVVRTLLGD